MKKAVFILIQIVFHFACFGQDTIYSIAYTREQPFFDFEHSDFQKFFMPSPSESINLWKWGIPSKHNFDNARSGKRALMTDTVQPYLPFNSSAFQFILKTDDATAITFWHTMDTDSLFDGGLVEVSTDNGTTWKNILNVTGLTLFGFYKAGDTIFSHAKQPGFTGKFGWKQGIISGRELNYYHFRFTFSSDGIETKRGGWMIDDMSFQVFGTGSDTKVPIMDYEVYPNPASDIIYIHSTGQERKIVYVKDLIGRTIFATDTNTLYIAGLPNGVYLIEIIEANQKYFKRFVKE